MTTTNIIVSGMTCGHCVNHVTEALQGLAGVTAVSIELEGGAVSIESTADLDPADVSAAVSAAGYSVSA